jgi:hypothetical protein
MSFVGSARQAGKGLRSSLQRVWQQQQQRSVGDLPVKSNKYVEDFATRRENIEHEFRWTGKSLLNIALFVGVAPYLIYTVRCVCIWGLIVR